MTLANRITTFRLLLIPAFCALVFMYSPSHSWTRFVAVAIYGLAAATDMLDGYVARRYRQQTPLGMRLDPLADKLLINLGFVFLAANPSFSPGVPMWFPIPILMRDMIIVVGALLLNAFVAPVTINVRVIGKVTTFLQNATLLAALLEWVYLPGMLLVTTLFTVASCGEYVRDGMRQWSSGERDRG